MTNWMTDHVENPHTHPDCAHTLYTLTPRCSKQGKVKCSASGSPHACEPVLTLVGDWSVITTVRATGTGAGGSKFVQTHAHKTRKSIGAPSPHKATCAASIAAAEYDLISHTRTHRQTDSRQADLNPHTRSCSHRNSITKHSPSVCVLRVCERQNNRKKSQTTA